MTLVDDRPTRRRMIARAARNIDPLDALTLVGLVLLASGVGIRLGADIAIALVGALLIVYAVAASRSEVAQ